MGIKHPVDNERLSVKRKPNILIVVQDSMRADHVGCYGYHRPTTPHMDQLAREGAVFTRAITAAPFSPASYASIFSNLYPHQHGVNGDSVRIWPDTWTRLPEKMQQLGYHTFGVSNNDFVSETMNGVRGFDDFFGMTPHWLMRQQDRVFRQVKKFCSEKKARQCDMSRLLWLRKGNSREAMASVSRFIQTSVHPFFGFVILMDPHAPYHAAHNEFCSSSSGVSRFMREVNGRLMWPRVMSEQRPLCPANLQTAIDLYDGQILEGDRWIGHIIQQLKDSQLLDDTLLMFCADHGEAFGESGVWGHGFSLNEYMTRVPLIVRHPSYIKPGTRSDALVQLHALHDTCLSVASGDLNVVDHPQSLMRVCEPDWQGQKYVFSEFPPQYGTAKMFEQAKPGQVPERWTIPMRAIRSRRWRLIEYGQNEIELFDLDSDPEELRAVHSQHPDIVDDMRKRLADHSGDIQSQSQTHAQDQPSGEQLEESVLERLRALGYVD